MDGILPISFRVIGISSLVQYCPMFTSAQLWLLFLCFYGCVNEIWLLFVQRNEAIYCPKDRAILLLLLVIVPNFFDLVSISCQGLTDKEQGLLLQIRQRKSVLLQEIQVCIQMESNMSFKITFTSSTYEYKIVLEFLLQYSSVQNRRGLLKPLGFSSILFLGYLFVVQIDLSISTQVQHQ